MVSYDTARYCMVLRGISWHCMASFCDISWSQVANHSLALSKSYSANLSTILVFRTKHNSKWLLHWTTFLGFLFLKLKNWVFGTGRKSGLIHKIRRRYHLKDCKEPEQKLANPFSNLSPPLLLPCNKVRWLYGYWPNAKLGAISHQGKASIQV